MGDLSQLSREALAQRVQEQNRQILAMQWELEQLYRQLDPRHDAVCEEMRAETARECQRLEAEAKRRCAAMEADTARKCRTYWKALAKAIAEYPPLTELSRRIHHEDSDETFGIDDY